MAAAKRGRSNWTLAVVLIAAVAVWYGFGDTIRARIGAFTGGESAQEQALKDAVMHYEIARRNGTSDDLCRAADDVVAAYLRAGDQANLERWQRIRADDCA